MNLYFFKVNQLKDFIEEHDDEMYLLKSEHKKKCHVSFYSINVNVTQFDI